MICKIRGIQNESFQSVTCMIRLSVLQLSISTAGSCFRVLNYDQSDHYVNSMGFIVARDPVTKEFVITFLHISLASWCSTDDLCYTNQYRMGKNTVIKTLSRVNTMNTVPFKMADLLLPLSLLFPLKMTDSKHE